jgi:hypothetical protein
VSLHVTVTETSTIDGYGFVSVQPCNRPVGTSLLNFATGETRAGTGVFGIPAYGLCAAVHGRAHIIVDLTGWHLAGPDTGFVPVVPTRVADSRTGVQIPGQVSNGTAIVDLTALVAAAGFDHGKVAAVWVNLTVVAGGAEGFLTAGPCNQPASGMSTVNFTPRAMVANGGLFPFGDGRLCVQVYGTADLIVDVSGVLLGPLVPSPLLRVADTRHDATGVSVRGAYVVQMPADLPVGAAAVVNLTAVDGVESGWLSAASCERGAGETSSVNFPVGSAVANVAVIEVGPSRTICVYTSTSVHVIVDHIATMS